MENTDNSNEKLENSEKNNTVEIEKIKDEDQTNSEKLSKDLDSSNSSDSNISSITLEENEITNSISEKNEISHSNTGADNLKKKSNIFFAIFIYTFSIILIFILIFTIYNMFNPNITSGISIQNIDVSNQSPSDAKYILENHFQNNLPDEIKIKHNEFESTISLKQIDAHFDIKSAVNEAFLIGKDNNILKNDLTIINTMLTKKNIVPNLILDKKELSKMLSELSPSLPDRVEESSYYMEGNQLIVTAGKQGNIVDIEKSISIIEQALTDFENNKSPIEIAVLQVSPKPINIEQIHEEIYKLPQDAYYKKEPFTIIPSKNGVDFNISVEEAKKIVSNPNISEFKIPLKTLYPKVTTNMIGTQAFPDLLATYSSYYNASNSNRTTNLILATKKINGKVLMPGEIFSFNKIVGRRTVAAGYKNAYIYVDGKSVDGLAGGICQTASTLYNAALYANLGIVERHNHQIQPSYAPVSRDATVFYGSQDFQFKNTRNYPIKIVGYVSGGVTTFKIFGKREENEPKVELTSYVTHKTPTTTSSVGYRILKRNGKVISKTLLSKDTYIKEKK